MVLQDIFAKLHKVNGTYVLNLKTPDRTDGFKSFYCIDIPLIKSDAEELIEIQLRPKDISNG